MPDNETAESGDYEVTGNESDTAEQQWILDTIKEELQDSEKYYNKFIETKNEEYKKISRDELKHSEILIKIARENNISDSELEDFLTQHNIMLARLH